MKKVLAILVALCLMLGTCAFAEGTEARNFENTPHPTQDPFGKYEEPITVTTVFTATDGAFWFTGDETLENNIYTKRYLETLGINYTFKWTCPSSQRDEKINTMLATGDLPDFFAVNREQFEQLYAAGMLEDLTDVMVDYASDYTRGYLSGDYKSLMDVATRDGRYYGIVNGFSYKDGGDMIWVRKDWLTKLGLETPKSFTDLENVMEAFVKNDPDDNGEADTYAIAFYAVNNGAAGLLENAFYNMFGAYPDKWMVGADGTLVQSMFGEGFSDGTRAALEKAHEYYEKGYISPDFTTMDFDMRNADIFNGKCGILFGNVWEAYWPLILHLDVDPNADWVPVAVPSVNGGDGMIARDVAEVERILVCRKGAEHPEALVKMTNLYHDLNNNPETMEFSVYNTRPEDSASIFSVYPLQMYNPSFNYEGYKLISAAQESGNLDGLCEAYKLFYDQGMDYKEKGESYGWSPYRSYLKDESSLGVVAKYVDQKLIRFNEYTSDPTEHMIDNAPTVKKMFDTLSLDIIVGNKDITAFDEYLPMWQSLYGDVATQEVNAWFQANGAKSLQAELN